jgi:DNA-binding MarR family transcriptional regulator
MNNVDGGGVVPVEADSGMMLSLLVAAHALEDRIEKSLGNLGLSLAKLNVLSRMIEADEPLALSAIAARLNCVRSNVTQLVDRLESEGLVKREADPADRRSIRAVLTTEGRKRQAAGAAELQRLASDFTRALPATERDVLGRTLSLLR